MITTDQKKQKQFQIPRDKMSLFYIYGSKISLI